MALCCASIDCGSSAASGGSCKAGAAAAGLSRFAGGTFGANDLLSRVAIGAVASKVAGGKAEQGALLSAMELLYNDCSGGTCTTSLEQTLYNWLPRYKFGTLLNNKLLGGGGDSTVWEVVDGLAIGVGAAARGLQSHYTLSVAAGRAAYTAEVAKIAETTNSARAAGAGLEDVARTAHAMLREIGVKFKDLTPPDLLEKISARNLERYGDKLGPTVEWLRAQGRSWE